MKGLTLACMMSLALPACLAQNRFAFGLGAGFSSTSSGNGFVALLEPAHRPDPRVAIGLRIQYMRASNFSLASMTGNMQWYLTDTKWRPLIGLGAGLFHMAAKENNWEAKASFGCYPRLGVEVGKFMLALDFNFVVKPLRAPPVASPASSLPGFEPPSPNNPNYLSTTIVYLFGGGWRK